MHADGYAGLEDLYRSGSIREVACMAHVWRKFVDIHRSQASPIAEEAIGRIAQLYAVEKEARGSPPIVRVELRKAHAAPVFDDLEVWLALQLTTISGKSSLAAAICYALARMDRLRPYLDNGILELDNNAAERGMRATALMAVERLAVSADVYGRPLGCKHFLGNGRAFGQVRSCVRPRRCGLLDAAGLYGDTQIGTISLAVRLYLSSVEAPSRNSAQPRQNHV